MEYTRRTVIKSALGAAVLTGGLARLVTADSPSHLLFRQGTPGASPSASPAASPSATPSAQIVPEIPVAITIQDAGVDAEVEQTKIVDGQMIDPSGPWIVAWYEGTGKIGEHKKNMLMAGHVDYWGVGPSVFKDVAQLQKGAEVVLTGEKGAVATYVVEYVERVNNRTMTPEKLLEITGPTKFDALTLITCGGEFDYDKGEYIERDVIRCKFKMVKGGNAAGPSTPVATPDATPTDARPEGQPSKITEDGVNVRSEPSTDAETVTVLDKDAVVNITGEPKDADGYTWYPIKTEDGEKGWVVKDYLELPE